MKINTHKINVLLAKKGLTQTALAELSGMTRQNVCAILNRGTCYPVSAGKIARALGVDVEELLEV